MSVTTKVIDGHGSGRSAKVDTGGYLRVLPAPYPPTNDDQDVQLIFRQFLTLNGDGITTDMRVDGATTSQSFYIEAVPGFDIYIKNLSIVLADTNTDNSFNTFGDLAALTNGCRLYYSDSNGEINIGTELKTNFDLIRLSLGNPAFGGRASAGGAVFNPFFLPDAIGATADAIIPVIDFSSTFGFTYGLRLRNETTNRIVLEINDNLSAGLDGFDIIAYGFKIKVDN